MLHNARLLVGIATEQFGSRVGFDEIEPWQHKVLVEADLDGPRAQRVTYLGGDRSDGKLPVRKSSRMKDEHRAVHVLHIPCDHAAM